MIAATFDFVIRLIRCLQYFPKCWETQGGLQPESSVFPRGLSEQPYATYVTAQVQHLVNHTLEMVSAAPAA
jgi:hypothetical protein